MASVPQIASQKGGRRCTHRDGYKLWRWFKASPELDLVQATHQTSCLCVSREAAEFYIEVGV